MNENLIFDGNTIYELDPECMQARKRRRELEEGERIFRSQEYGTQRKKEQNQWFFFFLCFFLVEKIRSKKIKFVNIDA